MKGALVHFASSFGATAPNVTVFQFNPETLRHTWTQAQAATSGSNPLAVQGLPGESFSFTLSMSATDDIERGEPLATLATTTGIYGRLAALELLLFPVSGPPSLAAAAPVAGARRDVPTAQLPTVLFVWGPGRIVPVRVTGLTITEKLFDALLNPTHADAQIELRVLTPAELEAMTGPLKEIANAAYQYSQAKRSALALANLANAASAVLDLPPIPGT